MQETKEAQVQSLGQEIPWRRAWQPTPGLLPGESHGQRSLAGYNPWGHKESDTTKQLTNRCCRAHHHVNDRLDPGVRQLRVERAIVNCRGRALCETTQLQPVSPCGNVGSVLSNRPSFQDKPEIWMLAKISQFFKPWESQRKHVCQLM